MGNKKNFVKAGIVGFPLDYSISPDIHKYLFEQSNIQGEYREFRIQPEVFSERIPNIISEYPFLNVTIPYKKEIISRLQGTADSARLLGVVNTVAHELGYNTDGMGMELALSDWPKPEQLLIIGAGNTSRTALYTMLDLGIPHIYMVHRNFSGMQRLKQELIQSIYVEMESTETFKISDSNQKITFFMNLEDIMDFEFEKKIDLIINTTSAGMFPEVDQLPLPDKIIEKLFSDHAPKVFDVIYNPVKTKLLALAEQNDLQFRNGLTMLFYQAYASQTIWFNEEHSIEKAEKLWVDFNKKFKPEDYIREYWQDNNN